MKLTDEQIEILLHLVKSEMNNFCGDRGYAELAQIKVTLEQHLAQRGLNSK
ncbi:hypothetical protein VIBR0546_02519 [Vibrio brasiliensis LMG 20546]|uniref:Uncharacterized protein n=1 Tax=Vibrio brasiliensis LMG 20546 TaxID=945543 RepID=E8LYR0_9VIBR|nr:hypothetical protein VIBR0546_02519 [Vibrio brasiliensis LMG 20546]